MLWELIPLDHNMTATKIVNTVLIALWIALLPIHPAIISALCLPAVDLVLGLLVANRDKKPITSSGIKRTVAKIMLYEFAIVLAFCVETYMTSSVVPIIHMVTGLIGVTELKSCIEHMDDLYGSPLFLALLARLAPAKADKPVTININPEDPTQISITPPEGD